MKSIEGIAVDSIIRYLVQRQIFCSITNKVLDERTCVVIYDEAKKNIISAYDPSIVDNITDDAASLLAGRQFRVVTPSERHTIAL